MDVIEYTPTRGQYAYTFGGVASAMRVRPGTASVSGRESDFA